MMPPPGPPPPQIDASPEEWAAWQRAAERHRALMQRQFTIGVWVLVVTFIGLLCVAVRLVWSHVS